MQQYLQSTDVIDWKHQAVLECAARLAVADDLIRTARACFEFVRDEIRHSRDFELDPATCSASSVLIHGTGYCYAKSHLLAALLRANGLPSGFCYQRLCIEEPDPPFSLHGYNAVYLPFHGWYRLDARGNKQGVDAQFEPPRERLAFGLQSKGEFDFETIFADPLDCVVKCLQSCDGWKSVLFNLPDVEPVGFSSVGLRVRSQGAVDRA